MTKNSLSVKNRLNAEQRQKMLLKSATEIFFSKGFKSTSLDDIINAAGGSRRNIYTQYGSKEGLFLFLVKDILNNLLTSLQQKFDKENSLRDNLFIFSDKLLSILFDEDVLNLSRLVLAEELHFPELAQSYFGAGPEITVQCLAGLLEQYKEKGEIHCRDCKAAAGIFFGMLHDKIYWQVLLKQQPTPSEHERRQLIEDAVEIFLNGVQTKGKNE